MPIHSDKNLYPGINPHLNSYLQHVTGWKGFHNHYLEILANALETQFSGAYYISGEESLQIGIYDLLLDAPLKPQQTVPDLTIHKGNSPLQPRLGSSQLSTPILTLPVEESVEELEYIHSLVIYKLEESAFPGKAVTRIELLSPANKPPGSHYQDYRSKRRATLNSGLCLVEMDYLHQRRPIDSRLPSYADKHPTAYPYYITVNDPRPSISLGVSKIYGFGVLDPFPLIIIPLDEGDFVEIDYGKVYHETVESRKLYSRILVDYEQEPINFAAYSEADQQKIREYMAQIAVTHHS